MKRLHLRAVAILLTVFCLPLSLTANRRKPARIATGTWGGQHVAMNVNESSATIEFDCANGQIDGPLTVDRRGRFNLKGTFSREHGGPVRNDEQSSAQAARYTGRVDGKKMTLTITLSGEKGPVGTFELTRGSARRVFKCL